MKTCPQVMFSSSGVLHEVHVSQSHSLLHTSTTHSLHAASCVDRALHLLWADISSIIFRQSQAAGHKQVMQHRV